MPKSAINDIVLIGSGNVAAQLVYSLISKNKNILQVYSRNENNAKLLAETANSSYTDDIYSLRDDADLYIIAVPDEGIEMVSKELNLKNGILVHTAGSVEMNVLKTYSVDYGVLYPLQSLNKDRKIDFYNKVPLCIEANTEENRKLLFELASSLSKEVIELDSEQRKTVHLAAVFVNNFTNYLQYSASTILKQANISPDILRSLIIETSDIGKETEIFKKLTGPAIRKDMETIRKHLDMLKDMPELRKVYEVITENILEFKV